jgi:TRAP-type C4-dicarboxylate transport system permease small subunit
MKQILRVQDAVALSGFVMGAGALGAIVVIYAYEVISRYIFGAPTLWASDTVSFLLLISVFATAPWLTREGGHVAVTIVPDLVPSARDFFIRAGFFVTAVVCLWATWICFGETLYLFKRGTTTLTTFRIPKWTLMAFITYGLLNSGLYFLRLAFGGRQAETQDG